MKKINTLLCAGFPAVGKSHLYNTSELKVLDSDSSKFDKEFFPQNYITHIKENIGEVDIIFISSHDLVRDALVKEGLKFTLVYPCIDLKDEYLKRYKTRGSTEEFINLIDKNWNDWIKQLKNQKGCDKVELKAGQFVSDVLYHNYSINDVVNVYEMYDEPFTVIGITKQKLLLEGDFSMSNNMIQESWIKITDVYKR